MSSYGETYPQPHPGLATYQSSSGFITPASLPTDVFSLFGVNGKTVQILEMWLIWLQNPAVTVPFVFTQLIKRSSANSGGTSSTPTPVSMDSNDPAAGAVFRAYSANPSLGTTVGAVNLIMPMCDFVVSGAGARVERPASLIYRAHPYGKPLIMNSAAEGWSLNFGGTTVPGQFAMDILWSEK